MKAFLASKFKRQCKHGTFKWNPWFVLVLAVIINLTVACALGYPLYLIELTKETSTIKTYEDAVWLLWMAASTVGFGEVNPSPGISRIIVGFMTIPGTMLIGAAINMASSVMFGWVNQTVTNAELRSGQHNLNKKLKEITRDIERIRQHFDVPDVVERKND